MRFRKTPKIELPKNRDPIESIGILALVNTVIKGFNFIDHNNLSKDLEEKSSGRCAIAAEFVAALAIEFLDPDDVFLLASSKGKFKNPDWKFHSCCIIKKSNKWYYLSPANFDKEKNPKPQKPLVAESLDELLQIIIKIEGGIWPSPHIKNKKINKESIFSFLKPKTVKIVTSKGIIVDLFIEKLLITDFSDKTVQKILEVLD